MAAKRESAAETATAGGKVVARIVQAPLRALVRARDAYVSGMTGLAEKTSRGGLVVRPGTAAAAFGNGSRCFHKSRDGSGGGGGSGDDDLRELVRAAAKGAVAGGSAGVPRSQSAGMARIEEDKPCDFGGYQEAAGAGLLRPRSKSCSVLPKGRAG